MAKRTTTNIARKAFAKADADFSTWLMMAKLGGFDDLPPNAQSFLMSYRHRLEKMSETEATQAAIREVYAAYYAEMGGEGEAPALPRSAPAAKDNVVDLKTARRPLVAARGAAPAATRATATASRRAWWPFLIFAGLVAVVAAIKFAVG